MHDRNNNIQFGVVFLKITISVVSLMYLSHNIIQCKVLTILTWSTKIQLNITMKFPQIRDFEKQLQVVIIQWQKQHW